MVEDILFDEFFFEDDIWCFFGIGDFFKNNDRGFLCFLDLLGMVFLFVFWFFVIVDWEVVVWILELEFGFWEGIGDFFWKFDGWCGGRVVCVRLCVEVYLFILMLLFCFVFGWVEVLIEDGDLVKEKKRFLFVSFVSFKSCINNCGILVVS